jgi:A/G-specific adenine glycosylase
MPTDVGGRLLSNEKMSSTNSKNIKQFQGTVWAYYRVHSRNHLPWRKTKNPYRILVSEIMLQQTQVDRVIPLYLKFIQRYPTPQKLAEAPLSQVLIAWQGLGYNRRAKMLHETAKRIQKSNMPRTIEELKTLPGIGPYTAGAVAAFAYNQDSILIETNIRTALMEHFFPRKTNVSDIQLARVLETVLPKGHAREWYAALMDYGAHLKRSGISHNARSRHHVPQSKFTGSLREARGSILRELTKGPATRTHLVNLFGSQRRSHTTKALEALKTEGFIELSDRRFVLAD